jgi:hypothetical protein
MSADDFTNRYPIRYRPAARLPSSFRGNAMSTIRTRTTAAIIVAIWMVGAALAADPSTASGARPGDDALTCDEIYAQGMAESQREQQEREKTRQQMKAQQMGTAALLASAMATGGATAPLAQKAAEADADRTIAMLGTPQQANARLQRLKQLWAQKQCVRK